MQRRRPQRITRPARIMKKRIPRQYDTRLERFRKKHRLPPSEWAAAAGFSRATFANVRAGSDPYVSTIRRIVIAARHVLERPVAASELFDLGEDTPPTITLASRAVATRPGTDRRHDTKLDRILWSERIVPREFAKHVPVARQTLLRLRKGTAEPSLSTLAAIVRTLRQMTGKPYKASHIYDVGEPAKADG
jgi:predicted transcriptional regulator